jgi:hypothetical protein
VDRRESIKSILLGSVGTGFLLQSCVDTTPEELQEKIWQYQYGRTPQEAAFDEKLFAEQFFTPTEMETITRMADIILPPHDKGSIAQAEFQLPIRGGLMWLDSECSELFNKLFIACSEAEQKAIFDEIAFPVPGKKKQSQEVNFFSLMRDLVVTGYFTSEVGLKDLGYMGNSPNVWDGIPQDVLDDHGMAYEEAWLAKCIDQSKRNETAVWDDDGNLLT